MIPFPKFIDRLNLGRLKRSWAIYLRSYELCRRRRRRLLRATCTRSWDNSGLQGFLRLDSARSWDNLGLRGSPSLDRRQTLLLDPSRRRSCRQERSTRGIHFHFFPLFWAKYAIWANSNYFVIAIPLLGVFFELCLKLITFVKRIAPMWNQLLQRNQLLESNQFLTRNEFLGKFQFHTCSKFTHVQEIWHKTCV